MKVCQICRKPLSNRTDANHKRAVRRVVLKINDEQVQVHKACADNVVKDYLQGYIR